MDVIVRLPDCDGQAADADGGCSQIAQNSQVSMSRHMDTSSTTQVVPNHGLTLKIQWFFLNEICTVTHSQASCEKNNSRKFYWNLYGKKYQIGEHLLVHRKQGLFLSENVDDM